MERSHKKEKGNPAKSSMLLGRSPPRSPTPPEITSWMMDETMKQGTVFCGYQVTSCSRYPSSPWPGYGSTGDLGASQPMDCFDDFCANIQVEYRAGFPSQEIMSSREKKSGGLWIHEIRDFRCHEINGYNRGHPEEIQIH